MVGVRAEVGRESKASCLSAPAQLGQLAQGQDCRTHLNESMTMRSGAVPSTSGRVGRLSRSAVDDEGAAMVVVGLKERREAAAARASGSLWKRGRASGRTAARRVTGRANVVSKEEPGAGESKGERQGERRARLKGRQAPTDSLRGRAGACGKSI